MVAGSSLFSFFLLSLISIALSSMHDNPNLLKSFEQQFSEFKQKYGKMYATLEENDHRFGVFVSNLRLAVRNQRLDPTARHGVTKFSDLTPSEYRGNQDMNIVLSLPSDVRPAPILPVNDLPAAYSLIDKGAVTPVKDEGDCKASWAFAAVGAVEGVHYLKSRQLEELSVQQLLECDRECNVKDCDKGCSGGYAYNAFEYILKSPGLQSDLEYPFTGNMENTCSFNNNSIVTASISAIYHIKRDEDQIAANLVKKGPITVLFNSADVQTYTDGVSCPAKCSEDLDETGLLVGYDDKSWIIKTSRGLDWGERGYFRFCKGHIACKTSKADPLPLFVVAKI